MSKKSAFFLAGIIIIIILIISAGVFYYTKNQNTALRQPNNKQKSSSDIEVITSDVDTSDWKTYRNEKLRFEFKYPKNWEYNVRGSGIVEFKDKTKKVYYEGNETYLVSVSVRELNDITSVKDYIRDWKGSKVEKNGWVKDVKVNNVVAIQGYNFFGLSTLIQDNNKIFIITKGVFSPQYKRLDKIYNTFLTTFKIID